MLAEAESAGKAGGRRVLELPNGWIVRREKVAGCYVLRFSGPDATPEWLEPLFLAIERKFLPEGGRRTIGRGPGERGAGTRG